MHTGVGASTVKDTVKVKKLKVGSKEWIKELRDEVLSHCPELVICQHCNAPALSGYQCWRCGSESPGNDGILVEEWM